MPATSSGYCAAKTLTKGPPVECPTSTTGPATAAFSSSEMEIPCHREPVLGCTRVVARPRPARSLRRESCAGGGAMRPQYGEPWLRPDSNTTVGSPVPVLDVQHASADIDSLSGHRVGSVVAGPPTTSRTRRRQRTTQGRRRRHTPAISRDRASLGGPETTIQQQGTGPPAATASREPPWPGRGAKTDQAEADKTNGAPRHRRPTAAVDRCTEWTERRAGASQSRTPRGPTPSPPTRWHPKPGRSRTRPPGRTRRRGEPATTRLMGRPRVSRAAGTRSAVCMLPQAKAWEHAGGRSDTLA